MIEVAATAGVERSSREVLEFVLDLEAYRSVDTKIGRIVRPAEIDGAGVGEARYWGRLRGMPPAPDTNTIRLERWTSVTFTGAPWQPARLALDFRGRFRCVDTDDGCVVTHDYRLAFRRPLRWIYEPLLAGWLQDEVDDEVRRLAEVLARPASPPDPGRSERTALTATKGTS